MKYKIIIAFAFSFCLQSCGKDFLKPKPLSFFAPENVYINKAGFEAGLVTVRQDLKNDFYGAFCPLAADVSCVDGGTGSVGIIGSSWKIVTPSSGNRFPILSMLGRDYGYIKNTNVIISRIDNIEWASQEDRNAILAQAYFYRSYWYYRLVHTYGDIPFVGEELVGAKLDFFSHSRWAILKKIQSDLEFAAEWLPETGPKDQPSKYAALHLLAKVYMVNLEFDKAIEAATAVINGPYALMKERFGASAGDPDHDLMWDLHRPENKALLTNTEAILVLFDRMEAPTQANSDGSYTMRNFHPGWFVASLVRDSRGLGGVISRFPDGSYTPQYAAYGEGNPNIVPVPWMNYDLWQDGPYTWNNTPDLRRSDGNWVDTHELLYNNPASVDYGKPFDPENFAKLADSLLVMFPFPYYKTYFPHEKGYTGNIVGGNGDYYVYRLAETYLIRAEAYFWKEQLDLAANDINMVRERAHALPITAADVTLDYIFDERTRELYIEEMRHTELVRASYIMGRLNKEGYSMAAFATNNWFYDRVMSRNKNYQVGLIGSYEYDIQPFNVLWPIDNNVITANTLGVINQNEGYEGAQNNVPPLETIP
ncbi:RagB/SusD family nutrient uptake outer membrane protein [Agriterribacter sp.]|uniref:RagB/SusD family nutrient uptake outer membrane protein n=1 Tax=Agriterribacter sp. TaxID=2821509 RepID=UPI002B89517E|nr:RagB/SusD family nutrient uptake outer membrane protein [Agriterribacter sp.]HRP55176.1 RagB/SusD family nutrient uptake outer membrane protein [Agriterribacter sp.]